MDTTTSGIILWVYIVLLVAGGLMGLIKAGSKVSLIMSVAFAIPLSLCALHVLAVSWLPDLLLGLLIAVFAMRLTKTRKFMPSGLMLSLTAAALLALLVIK
jgi:uncharacterized membrane protein (UPF0136 family)